MSERSLAAGSGSRKRGAEDDIEQLDKERSERAEAAEAAASSSSSGTHGRKREAEVPVQQADRERREQLFREGGSARALTQVSERSLADAPTAAPLVCALRPRGPRPAKVHR